MEKPLSWSVIAHDVQLSLGSFVFDLHPRLPCGLAAARNQAAAILL
jgi:hypothetical protein